MFCLTDPKCTKTFAANNIFFPLKISPTHKHVRNPEVSLGSLRLYHHPNPASKNMASWHLYNPTGPCGSTAAQLALSVKPQSNLANGGNAHMPFWCPDKMCSVCRHRVQQSVERSHQICIQIICFGISLKTILESHSMLYLLPLRYQF